MSQRKPTIAIWRANATRWLSRVAVVHIAIVLLTAGEWDDVLTILVAWALLLALLRPSVIDVERIDDYRLRNPVEPNRQAGPPYR